MLFRAHPVCAQWFEVWLSLRWTSVRYSWSVYGRACRVKIALLSPLSVLYLQSRPFIRSPHMEQSILVLGVKVQTNKNS